MKHRVLDWPQREAIDGTWSFVRGFPSMNCSERCGLNPSILTKILGSDRGLNQRGIPHHYRARQILFDENCPLEAVHCIHSGRVKLYKLGPAEEEVILQVVGPGALIGYIPLLDSGLHDVSAETLTEVDACALDPGEFRTLVGKHPALTDWLARRLAIDVRAAHEEIVARTCLPAISRVARLLISFLDDAVSQEGSSSLRIHLKRWEIAQMVGSTPETVSRVLRELHGEGFLKLDRSSICVLQSERLRERASGLSVTPLADRCMAS